jgi:trans-aconitate methyltransferase
MTSYEFDANKYTRMSRYQREAGLRLIGEIEWSGQERVLDMGCGDGVLTAEIARHVPQGSVLGIDASANMIERCLASAAPAGMSNLEFLRMDIGEIAFDSEFDFVFSNATLHWVHDHRRMLANVRRALRPGGRLRFGFAGEGNSPVFASVVRRAMADAEFAPSFAEFAWPWYFPAMGEYRQLLAESPLVSAQVSYERIEWIFADAAEMTGWMDQPCLVPFLHCIEEPHRQAFRDRVVREVLDRSSVGDGRHAERFCRIHVQATRLDEKGTFCLSDSFPKS